MRIVLIVSALLFASLAGLSFVTTTRPQTVAIGLDCQGEAVRVYAKDSAAEAARVCRSVALHRLPA